MARTSLSYLQNSFGYIAAGLAHAQLLFARLLVVPGLQPGSSSRVSRLI
jgi:hypothetical protein